MNTSHHFIVNGFARVTRFITIHWIDIVNSTYRIIESTSTYIITDTLFMQAGVYTLDELRGAVAQLRITVGDREFDAHHGPF